MSVVRVRMYRQGLGDCFLLTFPRPGGEAHVLIDCGVLLGTPEADERMRAVARDVLATTGKRLAALVVTHEHWDHVSGFLYARELFEDEGLKADQVWMAWTENPEDPLAAELAERKRRALRAVELAARQLGVSASLGARRTAARLEGLLGFYGELAAAGRKTTAMALDWVEDLADPRPQYLRPDRGPIAVPGVDGVRVYVLGPPRDRKLIRRSRPSRRHSEVYELAGQAGVERGLLAAVAALDAGEAAEERPFEEWFRIGEAEAKKEPLFQRRYLAKGEEWRTIEHEWLGAVGQLALKLDSHTNNTSLALAFELVDSQRVLLFPGDAQVGNWLSWQELEWKVGEGAETRTVTARDLLARTVLYKVGHHGSHNATLRERGLELMTSDELVAMIPVDRATARKRDWKMPFPSLHRRLVEKTRGRVLEADRGVPESNPGLLGDAEWKRFAEQRTKVVEDWLEYEVEL